MPVVLTISGANAPQAWFDAVFNYLSHVDEVFSTYKESSEISAINRGERSVSQYSDEMKEVFALAEETRQRTHGYFDIRTPQGAIDPSGIVKGWAISNAAALLRGLGCENFCLDVAGDIESSGVNELGGEWAIGIRNPFEATQIVKVIYPQGKGVATSGTYIRGQHIYDPHTGTPAPADLVSLTVIGPNAYEADRFATAAFAMGVNGVPFIEDLTGFEGYGIDATGVATITSGFNQYV